MAMTHPTGERRQACPIAGRQAARTFEGLPADRAFECRDLCFVLLKKIGRAGILIKGPSLKLLDPDSDQVARDVVAFGETIQCHVARNEVQRDLSLELDAMDAVLGHGFHPLKARQRRSIPNLQTVHRHGRIPFTRQFLTMQAGRDDPRIALGLGSRARNGACGCCRPHRESVAVTSSEVS